VFEEVRRVLKKNGTLWIVLGDTYAAYYGDKYGKANSFSRSRDNTGQAPPSKKSFDFKNSNIKPKDLIGIPWMIAFSLRDAGWYLRQDIIWSKSNPMPESVTDRCTKSHEYIFLMSKSPKYYYGQDAIRQPLKEQSVARLEQDIAAQEGSDRVPGKTNGKMKAVGSVNGMANKKSVWTVSTKPFKEAHFATFPEDLIVDCIKAGCPPGGTILDPFMGAGTTALVAAKLNRHYIGFELNAKYIKICNKRLAAELGMFNPQPV
jgi:DNA modification methylase